MKRIDMVEIVGKKYLKRNIGEICIALSCTPSDVISFKQNRMED